MVMNCRSLILAILFISGLAWAKPSKTEDEDKIIFPSSGEQSSVEIPKPVDQPLGVLVDRINKLCPRQVNRLQDPVGKATVLKVNNFISN